MKISSVIGCFWKIANNRKVNQNLKLVVYKSSKGSIVKYGFIKMYYSLQITS